MDNSDGNGSGDIDVEVVVVSDGDSDGYFDRDGFVPHFARVHHICAGGQRKNRCTYSSKILTRMDFDLHFNFSPPSWISIFPTMLDFDAMLDFFRILDS